MSRFIVTGASGFVGSALTRRISHEPLSLAGSDWQKVVAGQDFSGATIIHLGARVHDSRGGEREFQADNFEKTCVLARAASCGGAVRFVFASTAKVFGEESTRAAFRESDPPHPQDAYARSKLRAEQQLLEIGYRTGMGVVVVRIPLVYGREARGNFKALVMLANTAAWLPFAGIVNRRSLVHVDDLADALALAAVHPGAVGRTLLAAYPAPVSTPELIEALRRALDRPRRLFAVSPRVLEAGASMFGLGAVMRRLTRSLELDPSSFIRDLGWRPRVDLDEGIARSVRGGGRS